MYIFQLETPCCFFCCLRHYDLENLGVTLVCNTHWVFRSAWAIVKLFLDEKTQAKFVVVPGDGAAAAARLAEELGGAEKVPAFLGGGCACGTAARQCICMDPLRAADAPLMTPSAETYVAGPRRKSTTLGARKSAD